MWFCASTNPLYFRRSTPPQIFSRERRLGAIFNKLTMPTPGMTARTPDALDGDEHELCSIPVTGCSCEEIAYVRAAAQDRSGV